MTWRWLILLLIISSSAFGQDKTSLAEIRTKIYCDHCKRCESCNARLEDAVYALKGVKRVDVDEETMIIRVVYQPHKVDLDQIRRAVATAGYDADHLKADIDAYRKLDDCCKKR